VRPSNRPAAASAAPQNAAERARFIRRQEALTIAWLRSLGRSARTTSTVEKTAPTTETDRRD